MNGCCSHAEGLYELDVFVFLSALPNPILSFATPTPPVNWIASRHIYSCIDVLVKRQLGSMALKYCPD